MTGFHFSSSPGLLRLSGELDLDAAPDIVDAGIAALDGSDTLSRRGSNNRGQATPMPPDQTETAKPMPDHERCTISHPTIGQCQLLGTHEQSPHAVGTARAICLRNHIEVQEWPMYSAPRWVWRLPWDPR
jgi:hypothetical protein